jgi:hypothetical protein
MAMSGETQESSQALGHFAAAALDFWLTAEAVAVSAR